MLKVREHFPYARAAEEQETDSLEGMGCIGETINLSFSLESSEDISELEISALPLVGSGGTISAESIQIYVVHIWDQAGIGVYQSAPVPVAELLLKDDRVPLLDKYRRQYKHWRHLFNPSYVYGAPDVRLDGPVRTSLKKGKPKQIWIMLKPPHDYNAGLYQGDIAISVNQNTSIEDSSSAGSYGGQSVKLKIELAPIRLDEPTQERFLWYRGKLDWRDSQHYVNEDIFRAQLRDILEHGFTSVSISEIDRTLAQRAIEIVEQVGFNRYIVFLPPFPGDPHTLKYKSVTPVVYLSDEIDIHLAYPDDHPEDHILHHKVNWQRATDWKMKSMASLVSQTFANRFFDQEDIGHAPDILSYFLMHNREFVHLSANLMNPRAGHSYYYWQAYMEKPNLHRALSGVYLWKSRFAGISPYCYQHLPKYPFSPFNDFDEWEPEFHVGPVRKSFKDHMLTYPAANGSIPTIQWEGFRDGIIDLKSLVTLESALTRAKNAGDQYIELVDSILRRRDDFLARIDLRLIKVNSETDPEPYAEIRAQEYQAFRESNLRDILTLQQALGTP
jgi:hypothetical protein